MEQQYDAQGNRPGRAAELQRTRAAVANAAPSNGSPAGGRRTRPAAAPPPADDAIQDDTGVQDEHGTDADIELALNQLDDGWGETSETTFGEVEDGSYQCEIKSAVVNHSKASARLQVSWDLEIVGDPQHEGKYVGRHLFKHDGIADDNGRGWFRGGLARLGVEWPASAKELPDTLNALVGTYCQVAARTKKDSDRQNYYFNKALDADEIDRSTTPDAEQEYYNEDQDAAAAGDDDQQYDDGGEPVDDTGDATDGLGGDQGATDDAGDDNSGDPGGDTAATVNVSFDDKAIRPPVKQRVEAIAQMPENGFAPQDYNNTWELMCDVAEYLGVSGDFAKPADLMKQIEAQLAK